MKTVSGMDEAVLLFSKEENLVSLLLDSGGWLGGVVLFCCWVKSKSDKDDLKIKVMHACCLCTVMCDLVLEKEILWLMK